ncbi:MAG: hypothetical protein SH817_10410 [Leptospira sp.]|nr:hypothetical protein [Leptospira sp.]
MKSENKTLLFLQHFGIAIFFLGFITDAVLQFFGKAPQVSISESMAFPAFWSLSVIGLIFIASPIFPYAWDKWQKRK